MVSEETKDLSVVIAASKKGDASALSRLKAATHGKGD